MPILTTTALTKRYGSLLALDRLDLELGEGGIFGFLGPNGAGKTTALRLMLGLIHPSGGHAQIFGRDCWRESAAIKREVGYLPGDLRLYGGATGQLLLGLFERIRGANIPRTGRELAEKFELPMTQRVSDMSRGTRQKLGLVLALAHEPRLAILDEPTGGLDPIMQNTLKQHLRELAARGHTVLFSSHTLSEVEQLCDRVAILRRGRLVEDAALEALRARAPRDVRIAWRGAPPGGPPPPGLEVIERITVAQASSLQCKSRQDACATPHAEWDCRWHGSAEPLVQWLAGQAVADVTVSPPDLENLFHEYYRE